MSKTDSDHYVYRGMLENALRKFLKNTLNPFFLGISVSTEEFIVSTITYPIIASVYDDQFVFAVHFTEDISKIAKESGSTLEEVYRSLNSMRTMHSYSMDENYHLYYSVAISAYSEFEYIDYSLTCVCDAALAYVSLIDEWRGAEQ